MDTSIALHNIVEYFCDLLDLPEGDLPARADGHWDEIFRLAAGQNIYHYLAKWILEHWPNAISEEIQDWLHRSLEWNKTRNIILSEEILYLTRKFRQGGIPIMFLKGSAGHVRELYPLECRYQSDIDVMVEQKNVHASKEIMKSCNYQMVKTRQNSHPHHLSPYRHGNKLFWIEIHSKPYKHYFNCDVIEKEWENSEEIAFNGETCLLPSINDHVWILFRTDLFEKVLTLRLKELIELAYINKKYTIDYDLLYKRSSSDCIPNLIRKSLYDYDVLMNESFSKNMWDFSQWGKESIRFNRKTGLQLLYKQLRLYKASIKYYTEPGLTNKASLLSLIIQNEPVTNLLQLFYYPHAGILAFIRKITGQNHICDH